MPTYEELLAAGAEPAEAPKGKGLTYEQLVAAGAEPLVPKDAGTDARRGVAGGMRPAVAPDDDIELQPTEGPPGLLRKAFPRATERSRREDPISNDPLAALIVQGIPAAGAGALLGGGVLGGAAAGAASDPEHPIRGALLGAAVPAVTGAPAAVRAADAAIGRAAVKAPSMVSAGESVGSATGAYLGYGGGPVGSYVGHKIGSKIGAAGGRLADRGIEALADRHLARTAQFPRPPAYSPPTFPAEPLPRGGPIIDADIIHQPAAPPAPLLLGPAAIPLGPMTKPLGPLAPQPSPLPDLPPGAFGLPAFDEFGMPLTKAGPPAANHATVGGATNPGGLRADVIRDAAKARGETMPAPGPPDVEGTLGADLAKSVRLLDELRAGKITAQQAIAAGLSPGIVAKVLH